MPVAGGQKQIPLSQLAEVSVAGGPAMIRDEDGLLTGYVYVDIAGQDPGGYIAGGGPPAPREAGAAGRLRGQLERAVRGDAAGQGAPGDRGARDPLLIVLLLYLNTRSLVKTSIVLLAVPFSAVGAVWFLYLLGYNMSIGVWVGLIALLGVDAETGVFMLLYLDLAYEKARQEGRLSTLADLRAAIVEGAAKRIRPKFMTVATTMLGLVPDHVVHGDRGRCDEAHRGADGGGDPHLLPDGTDGLSGDLRDLEMEFRDQETALGHDAVEIGEPRTRPIRSR